MALNSVRTELRSGNLERIAHDRVERLATTDLPRDPMPFDQLASAGLLVGTFVGLKTLGPGFDPSGVVTATISLQDARYEDPARMAQLFDDTLARIRQYPGVQAAGVTLGLPYTRLLNLGFKPLDGGVDPDRPTMANVSYITPGYFDTLKVAVKQGRDLSQADQASSMPVAVVNEEFARRYYGAGVSAVGLHIGLVVRGERREIVGVVGNTRTTTSGYAGYSDPLVTPPIIYVPATQMSPRLVELVHIWFSPSWVVRGSGPIEATGVALRNALTAADPMLPIARLESMSDVQSASLAQQAIHDVARAGARRRRPAPGRDRHPRGHRESGRRAHAGARDPPRARRHGRAGDARCRPAWCDPLRHRRRDRRGSSPPGRASDEVLHLGSDRDGPPDVAAVILVLLAVALLASILLPGECCGWIQRSHLRAE